MSKKVIILGAGGHAKVIADAIYKLGDEVVGFLDDNPDIQGNIIYHDKKVFGPISDCIKYNECYFIIGVGSNRVRKLISDKYNLKWLTVIHPSAVVGDEVSIDEGSVIMPGAVVNPGTKIGKHCIINTGATIDHDNIIHDFVHVSPGAHLAGTVEVFDSTWVCSGATVINNVSICGDSIIGAGAVVIKDINDAGTYIGVPAKRVK